MGDTPNTSFIVSELSATEAALKRLLGSERFRKNASLRNLLEYLVVRTLHGEGDGIKETTVAMDVFGRSEDFDSRIDNIVRVQAHRLRKLLAAYYEAEGADEPIRFSLPRGGYMPRIEELTRREAEVVVTPLPPVAVAPVVVAAPVQQPVVQHRGKTAALLLTFAAGVVLTCLAVWVTSAARVKSTDRSGLDPSSDLAAIWGPLLNSRFTCVVSYSNPVFLTSGNPPGPRILIPYRGLLSAPPGAKIDLSPADLGLTSGALGPDPSFFYNDSWTGVGEVIAMQRLTALVQRSVPMRILRSRAVTYADLQGNNLVFLGSPWANEMQKKINVAATPLMNDNEGNVLNLQPRAGEAKAFRAQVDPVSRQLISTIGLFSVLPGVASGTRVYISAGVNTYGTGSAMDYVTSETGAGEIRRRLAIGQKAKLPDYFQAVLRSEIIRGEPANTQVVLVRALDSSGRSTVR